MRAQRPAWRDGIKASTLSTNARFVALLMADYWPKDDGAALWCTVETLIDQSGLSRASVYRAVGELRDGGWLFQAEPARANRAPRYIPTVPVGSHGETPSDDPWDLTEIPQGSHSATGGVSHGDPTLDTHHSDTSHGSQVNAGPRGAAHSLRKRARKGLTGPEHDAAWTQMQEQCESTGDDPWNVWHTLADRGAKNPAAWMASFVEKGQWEGYCGSKGIEEYDREGRPA